MTAAHEALESRAHWRDRALRAERELAEARKALRGIEDAANNPVVSNELIGAIARHALAVLAQAEENTE